MNPFLIVISPTDFREGTHYRLLTTEERKGKKWKAVTLTDIYFPAKCPTQSAYMLRQNGREWGRINRTGIMVRKGYAWNFCTCSPDLEKCASLPHDLLYQFSGCLWFPHWLTRCWADDLFHRLCVTKLGWAYRLGLALGSWAAWAKHPKDGETVELTHEIEPT